MKEKEEAKIALEGPGFKQAWWMGKPAPLGWGVASKIGFRNLNCVPKDGLICLQTPTFSFPELLFYSCLPLPVSILPSLRQLYSEFRYTQAESNPGGLSFRSIFYDNTQPPLLCVAPFLGGDSQ